MEDLVIFGGNVVIPGATDTAAWRILPNGWVSVSGQRISAIGSGQPPLAYRSVNARGMLITPGLIDLHVHGGGGADPLTGQTADILRMLDFHIQHGTTGLLVTTGALPQADLLRTVTATAATAELPAGAGILGVNLEGPYLCQAKRGAQPAEHIRPVSFSELDELLAAGKGAVKLLTIAPEVPEALTAVHRLTERGVVVSIGHTDATLDQTRAAFAAGASHATHTYNAMRGLHQREPGALGAIMLADDVVAELIMDGLHVHPDAARILLRLKGADRVCLITDAIAATGLPDGPASLFHQPLTIVAGAARLSDGTLAGSTLTMDRAVGNLIRLTSTDPATAVRLASLNPARVLGLADRKGRLVPGGDADITVLDADFTARLTVIGGQVRHDSLAS